VEGYRTRKNASFKWSASGKHSNPLKTSLCRASGQLLLHLDKPLKEVSSRSPTSQAGKQTDGNLSHSCAILSTPDSSIQGIRFGWRLTEHAGSGPG